jgi:Fe-S cluster biosynthesis and repair protein YggX
MASGSDPSAPNQQDSGNERTVFCVKLQKELPGLDEVPFDGHPLGKRIYDSVSKQAWGMWVEQMKMLMNEYRLNLGTQQAQEFLLKQMEEYFFGEGASLPPDFVPPQASH